MFVDTLKFAWSGLPFSVNYTASSETVLGQLRSFTATRALLGQTRRVVIRAKRERIVAHRLHAPILGGACPNLYASIESTDQGCRISGRFTFSVLARAAFWLANFAIPFVLASGIFRVVRAYSADASIESIFGFSLVALAAPVGGALLYILFHHQMQKHREDILEIAEALRSLDSR